MKTTPIRSILLASALALPFTAGIAQAQTTLSAPVATPIEQTVPDAVDTPYPGGTIGIHVDATDLAHRVFRTEQTIPVAAGTSELTLLYPEWLPGHHGPDGTIDALNGLEFYADGKLIPWRRDNVEVYAFHLAFPAGTKEITAKMVYTSPVTGSEGRIVMTDELMNLQFNQMTLYPAGHYVRQIKLKPSVTMPTGWATATALDGQTQSGDTVSWDETSYQVLVDSPIMAGKYHKSWEIGENETFEAFAHDPEELEMKPGELDAMKAMMTEAGLLFGSRPFDHYEFLVAISDELGGIGLEHHRSTEISLRPGTLTSWEDGKYPDKFGFSVDVLPHELVHSWNGKYRRPALTWTPDYREPMRNDLLWVYEGMTQYWDLPLAARSGINTKELTLGEIASSAGNYDNEPGRSWRALIDTTYDPITANRKAKPFTTFSRSEEYYNEGSLIWLEADMMIRTQTKGKKSLEDFAKLFYGATDGDYGEKTYTFDQLVADLNSVYPYDWAQFLRDRVYTANAPAPLNGIELGGYKLVYKDEPNPFRKGIEEQYKYLYLRYSLGMSVTSEGKVTGVVWDGIAFNNDIVSGQTIEAVNGKEYSADVMKEAITAAKDGAPIELLIKRDDDYRTVSIDYTGGLRYPWLEKTAKGEGYLDKLLAPKRK
ncbi:M61 family metallopeptidase [Croceicoccus mobilis]|uniref:Peptidase M61 n=1 Tax=Croceicoccus mobilis TaxID=1703339 RepID=A0A916Z1I4_9SPHN|nr:M61 family metallopeptidase [Croceicoccus mobilis]GGD71520.1 peptidase M61 [Croceicoccus mobilis]